MKKKKTKKVPKTGAVWKLSKEEATLAQKPHCNAYMCGNGVHGDTKYNRTKQKRSWKKELNNERASYRGPLPFIAFNCSVNSKHYELVRINVLANAINALRTNSAHRASSRTTNQ